MALHLTKDLQNGFVANYWKLSDVKIDLLNKKILFNLSLYKDSETRDANLSPISLMPYEIEQGSYDQLINSANFIQALYLLIKLQPEFIDAIDC